MHPSLSSPRSTKLGRRWLFNNHGQRTLEWDDHCDRGYIRWILREDGITLTGPTPPSVLPVVPADLLRREAAASLPRLLDDLATWVDIDSIASGQRYEVVTVCRTLYTLDTAEVFSKPAALEWALRTFEPRWVLSVLRERKTRPLQARTRMSFAARSPSQCLAKPAAKLLCHDRAAPATFTLFGRPDSEQTETPCTTARGDHHARERRVPHR